MVAPNFGDGNQSGGGNDGKVFVPGIGWIKVEKWNLTTKYMPKSEIDAMEVKNSSPADKTDDFTFSPTYKQNPIAKSIDEMIKAAIKKYQDKVLAGLDEDAELKNHLHNKHYGESPLAKLSSSSEDYQSFLKKACESIAKGFGVPGLGKTPFNLGVLENACQKLTSSGTIKSSITSYPASSGESDGPSKPDPDYLRKLYSHIDNQREQATVHLANHKPSRERIVYDAIVTNESGNRVVEPVELFVVSGRAGRVTFARPLAYLRSPFKIEDNSIRGDLRKLNLDGVYVTTDPANAEVVESMVEEISAGVRFAIYERNVGDELRLEATLRLEEGGYVLPERGEFDGGQDSWKCASERFWALLERVYWECVAVVGGSEVN